MNQLRVSPAQTHLIRHAGEHHGFQQRAVFAQRPKRRRGQPWQRVRATQTDQFQVDVQMLGQCLHCSVAHERKYRQVQLWVSGWVGEWVSEWASGRVSA